MKRSLFLVMILMLTMPLMASADEYADLVAKGDALILKGLDDIANPDVAVYFKEATEVFLKAAALKDEYAINWRVAQGARIYCAQVKFFMIDGWKEDCAKYGKLGMQYGHKAIEQEPNKIEGHFWYGACVGTYADGVSIITAFKEGLKNKTQKAFEDAYRIDKTYWDYCPPLCIGEFWYVLPWPLKDVKKARPYLEEYDKMAPAGSDNVEEGKVMLGMLLMESKDPADQARGRKLVEYAANGRFPFFAKMAQDALAK